MGFFSNVFFFAVGGVVGAFVAQNYSVPDVKKLADHGVWASLTFKKLLCDLGTVGVSPFPASWSTSQTCWNLNNFDPKQTPNLLEVPGTFVLL